MARCKGKSEPVDPALYARVKAEAKRRFPTYPSIYANSWLVGEYKRRGGRYRCASGKGQGGGLRRWYRERWVDLSRPLPGGGWAPCGRPEVEPRQWRRAYPKCRPISEARKMTSAQIKSAVRRKREAVRKQRPGKPTYVKTFVANPATRSVVLFGALGVVAGVALWWVKSIRIPPGL